MKNNMIPHDIRMSVSVLSRIAPKIYGRTRLFLPLIKRLTADNKQAKSLRDTLHLTIGGVRIIEEERSCLFYCYIGDLAFLFACSEKNLEIKRN